jgi:NAD(P)-dependent dehydrogenase (short-subunit alcohol dehydrogenase family)
MGRLSGRTAVITGSTRVLGLAIAKAYAQEGAAVVISSRITAAVDKVVQELRSAGHQATGLAIDVAEVDQVKRLAEHAVATFGKSGLEVKANGAGHFIAGALHEGWRRLSRQPGAAIELTITPVNG